MKQLINKFSHICIAYTLSNLGLILLNACSGQGFAAGGKESLIILAIIIAAHIVNWLLGLLPFHSKLVYTVAGFPAQFAVFSCILLIWYRIDGIRNPQIWFIKSSAIFIAVYLLVTLYHHVRRDLEAAEINRLLGQYGGSKE